MKTNIRDFVKMQRASFDELEPAPRDWKRIAARMNPRRLWDSLPLWRAAAVVFFVVAAGLTVGQRVYHRAEGRALEAELTDVETYYNGQINEKIALIRSYNGNLNGFTEDFHQLEAMYSVLKEQMRREPTEKVKDALVLNLLVRVDLLNQRLHRLDQRASVKEKSEI